MEMKCVVLKEPYKIEIESREILEPGSGEVLLETQFGGICGGDVAAYRGNFFLKMCPIIQGHAFSAKIAKVDPNNNYGLKEGMLVTGLSYYGCGTCHSCEKGFVQCDKENKTISVLQDGAFRQYSILPEWKVYDCTGLDAQDAALIEPLVIGHHAAKRPDIQAADKVLVIGAGTIGVVTAVMAKHYGGDVTICDMVQGKLDTAKNDFNIPHILLNDNPSGFLKKTEDATDGNGYDIVMEAVGSPQTFYDSLEAVAISEKVSDIIGIEKEEGS